MDFPLPREIALDVAVGGFGIIFIILIITLSLFAKPHPLPSEKMPDIESGIQPSISHYHYHPRLSVLYGGILCCMGLFLIFHNGSNGSERVWSMIAGCGAVLTVSFSRFGTVCRFIHLIGTIAALGPFFVLCMRFAKYAEDNVSAAVYVVLTVFIGVAGIYGLACTVYKSVCKKKLVFRREIFVSEVVVIVSFSFAWILRAVIAAIRADLDNGS